MKAGFAEIDFTPPRGFMPGHFDANYAIGAYTPLLANAAAFESGGETVILISADHLHFSNSYGGEIRQRIADATGVPFCNVMLASTHTHTGPAFDVASGKTPAEPNTAQVVAHRTVLAGIRAFENRKDGATLAIATTEEKRFSFCRDVVMADGTIRTNPKEGDVVRTCDTPDHTVEVMRVTQEGRTVAILVSFANHPDTNGRRGRTKYCADWPGYMRQALKEKYGEDVVVLFFNGCFGDLNHYDFVHKTHLSLHCAPDVNIPECIGRGLADTVAAALDRITETVADETVAVFENSLTVKRRQITPGELAWAKEVMERAKTEFLLAWENSTATAYLEKSKDVPETMEFAVTGYRVGPWGIIALPGEMYSAVGKAIKQGSPFAHTIPVGLCNGSNGYVIPDHVRDNGSYEGRFSSGLTGYGALDAIIAGSVEALEKLY